MVINVPEWFNNEQELEWKQAMAEAQMKQQMLTTPYYTKGLVNWNIGPSTQPLPKMGDMITPDSIAAIVRHEMDMGAGKAVVKCQHCGMWAARYCACGKCGAPVD